MHCRPDCTAPVCLLLPVPTATVYLRRSNTLRRPNTPVCRQTALRSRFPNCLVQMCGSSVSGLGFRGCDLDLYADINAKSLSCGPQPDSNSQQNVHVVAPILDQLPHLCANIVPITQARVPIVKFTAPQLGGIQCDLSFRDPISCHKSQLIGWLMKAGQ